MGTDDLLKRAREASAKRRFARGFVQTEISVPTQRAAEGYPAHVRPPPLVLGETRLCPRCHGYKSKKSRTAGYQVDPFGGIDKDGNPRRCIKCNGWGYIPNIGI